MNNTNNIFQMRVQSANEREHLFGNQEEINVLTVIHPDEMSRNLNWGRICVLRNEFNDVDGQRDLDTYHYIHLPQIITAYRVSFEKGNPVSYFGMNCEKENENDLSRAFALEEVSIDEICEDDKHFDYYILRFNTNYFRGVITLW